MKGKNEDTFFVRKAWSIITKGFNELENEDELSEEEEEEEKLEENRMKDAKALSKIQNGVSPVIFFRIIRAQISKEA